MRENQHFRALFSRRCFLLLIAMVLALCAGGPIFLGRMYLGSDIADLPENPTIEQQIAAGRKQVDIARGIDNGLDSNREVFDYFNDIAVKLVAASDQKPLFPIKVHVSTFPVVNAHALPGGQIVFYEKMFDTTDNEAQLVSVIAHEISHELHNDFMVFWRDYKHDMRISTVPAACWSNR